MPRATVNLEPTEKKFLKTVPEGYVILKRLSYGQKLERQNQAMKMSMEVKKGRKDTKADIDMLNHASTIFDFKMCLVEHNLEDDNGRTLNLHSPTDIDMLDPRTGEEISTLIEELNNFEEAGDEGN